MKTSITILFTTFLHAIVLAQTPQESATQPDYFQFRFGKVYQTINENEVLLNKSIKLQNGMMVYPDGKFNILNKNQKQLKSGEYLDLDGKVFETKSALDNQLRRHQIAADKRYYLLRNGEVICYQNGKGVVLEDKTKLENGTILYPNGLYKIMNGDRLNLHEGECLDHFGRKYQNIQTFHKQMENSVKN